MLSTNFVTGVDYSPLGTLRLQNIIIYNFKLEEHLNLIYLPPRWFTINSPSEYIHIFLKRWPSISNILIPQNFQISFTILLKRIN